MKKQTCRKDFISDGSSSDDDSLPELGSLRDRLVRKRQFSKLSSCANSIETVPQPAYTDFNQEEKLNGQHSASNNCGIIPQSWNDVNMNNDSVSPVDELEYEPVSCVSGKSFQTELSDITDIETGPKIKTQSDRLSVNNKHVEVSKSNEVESMKKRTAEEIQERKRKAQEKKEERDKLKAAKESEKEMRKVERESKKQFALGSCLKYMKVLIDTNIVNECGLGMDLFKACNELGVTCETKELPVPFTIIWLRQVTECKLSADNKLETAQIETEEQEMLVVIPVTDFVHMVNTFKQKQRGDSIEGVSFKEYIEHIRTCQPDKNITIVVPGLQQYLKELKSKTQAHYRDKVKSSNSCDKSKRGKGRSGLVTVSQVDVEEAVTYSLLHNGCTTVMLDTSEDVADMVRRFSKAVAERVAKKDRFDPVFSFLEEGTSGVKVEKNMVGLLKVWKQQLLQFKNISPDIAQAIIAEYPSPLLLRKAYQKCSTEKEAVKLLENIVVRRGAGVLETTRRVGKELSRRIFIFFTSEDAELVIK